jgi:hypothetical protein
MCSQTIRNTSNANFAYHRLGNVKATQIWPQGQAENDGAPAHPFFAPYNPALLSFVLSLEVIDLDSVPSSLSQALLNNAAEISQWQYFYSIQNRPIDKHSTIATQTTMSLRAHSWMHHDASTIDGQYNKSSFCDVAIFPNDKSQTVGFKDRPSNAFINNAEVHTHSGVGMIIPSPANLRTHGLQQDITQEVWSICIDHTSKRGAITRHLILSDKEHDQFITLTSQQPRGNIDFQIFKDQIEARKLPIFKLIINTLNPMTLISANNTKQAIPSAQSPESATKAGAPKEKAQAPAGKPKHEPAKHVQHNYYDLNQLIARLSAITTNYHGDRQAEVIRIQSEISAAQFNIKSNNAPANIESTLKSNVALVKSDIDDNHLHQGMKSYIHTMFRHKKQSNLSKLINDAMAPK